LLEGMSPDVTLGERWVRVRQGLRVPMQGSWPHSLGIALWYQKITTVGYSAYMLLAQPAFRFGQQASAFLQRGLNAARRRATRDVASLHR